MGQFKSYLTSKGVWLGVIGFLLTTAWGVKNLQGVDPEAFANAMVSLISGAFFVGTTVFRILATKQLTGSADVAQAANHVVAVDKIPPKQALVVAKAKVAANKSGREIR